MATLFTLILLTFNGDLPLTRHATLRDCIKAMDQAADKGLYSYSVLSCRVDDVSTIVKIGG